uniref:Uncharacterized protein n=1 Tax=Gouania willdenowi TaxID=441366 RepID=A0A8C5EJ59_GOUWI
YYYTLAGSSQDLLIALFRVCSCNYHQHDKYPLRVYYFIILGCTWVLSLYHTSLFFQVLFIVLNSQQGTFLYIVHCLLNKEVKHTWCQQFSNNDRTMCPRNCAGFILPWKTNHSFLPTGSFYCIRWSYDLTR